MWGGSDSFLRMIPVAAASQPDYLPMTSMIMTLVLVRHMDLRSMEASSVPITHYLAAEPNPGLKSVWTKSLLMVLGIPMMVRSHPNFSLTMLS